MKFLRMVREESAISLPRLVAVATLAGISNALVLAVINMAAEQTFKGTVSSWLLALFLGVVTLYTLTQRYVMLTTAQEMDRILHKIRLRITGKVRRADLRSFENIGHTEIYRGIHKDTTIISESSMSVVDGAQSALLVFFTVLYIGWLSLTAFVLTVTFVCLALLLYFQRRKHLRDSISQAAVKEKQLMDALTDLLNGFKSVRINSLRSEDLFAHINELSSDATHLNLRMRANVTGQFIFAQMSFFLLMAAMVFVVPRFSLTYTDVVVQTITAILFLMSPVGSLVGAIPTFASANAAAERISALEGRLDVALHLPPETEHRRTAFREIRMEGVTFHYESPEGQGGPAFGIGPIELTLRPGEVVFIAGGNGAGKSTLLKLLTGLYSPTHGVVRLDGVPVTEANQSAFHNLFTPIFSDFHVFRRLYGIRLSQTEQVDELLQQMELEEKTRLEGDEFETLELSTGQRKRLALVVGCLEDKPILVLDEWAADQDPRFRRKFYEEVLPRLRQQGKTVVAVTHDDRYFGMADRLLTMCEGSLLEFHAIESDPKAPSMPEEHSS